MSVHVFFYLLSSSTFIFFFHVFSKHFVCTASTNFTECGLCNCKNFRAETFQFPKIHPECFSVEKKIVEYVI